MGGKNSTTNIKFKQPVITLQETPQNKDGWKVKNGYVIDDSIDPNKEMVYKAIIGYYGDPVFCKIRDAFSGETKTQSIYMCKIASFIGKDYRYLVVTVNPDNNEAGTLVPLSNLRWVSFQTRTLQEAYNHLKPHSYEIDREIYGRIVIVLNKRNLSHTEYVCKDIPVIVTLLHTKPDNLYEYPQSGNLMSALETYRTILTF